MKTIFFLIIFFIIIKSLNSNIEFFGNVNSCKTCINKKIIKNNFKKKKICALVYQGGNKWVNHARSNGCSSQCNLRWTAKIANGVKNYLKNSRKCR